MASFILCWYISATWWIPPFRLRYGRNDIMGDVSGFYREQLRPFGCGTAHRPFPTVSLVGGHFQLGDSKDGRIWVAFLRIRLLFLECFTLYRCLISQGCALPASPVGKLLYRASGCLVYCNAPEKLQKRQAVSRSMNHANTLCPRPQPLGSPSGRAVTAGDLRGLCGVF